MTWKINWSNEARKQLRRLDKTRQKQVLAYMRERISDATNPRAFGKPLRHEKFGLWRYRVVDVRVICQIQNDELVVLVLNVGHRKSIYK